MTRAEIRRTAHSMLVLVEWLDKHATTRVPSDGRALEFALKDLEKGCLRVMEANTRVSHDVREREAQDPPELPSTEPQ